MHRNGEIKQSHIERLWNSLYSSLCWTWRICLVFALVKHWARLSRWKYVRHMQSIKGWVKITKIPHKHWTKHNNIMKTAVSKFCNMPEGCFFLQLLYAKCLVNNLKFFIMKWTKLHVILSCRQWLFGCGSLFVGLRHVVSDMNKSDQYPSKHQKPIVVHSLIYLLCTWLIKWSYIIFKITDLL